VAGFDNSDIVLRHSLAFAAEIHRRVVINRETSFQVAQDLGLRTKQVQGAARLLRDVQSIPSPERLALVVMHDPGLDDNDIAEIFGRTRRWVQLVKDHKDELLQTELIAPELEWLEEGLQPDMPSPAEIWSHAERLRLARQPRHRPKNAKFLPLAS